MYVEVLCIKQVTVGGPIVIYSCTGGSNSVADMTCLRHVLISKLVEISGHVHEGTLELVVDDLPDLFFCKIVLLCDGSSFFFDESENFATGDRTIIASLFKEQSMSFRSVIFVDFTDGNQGTGKVGELRGRDVSIDVVVDCEEEEVESANGITLAFCVKNVARCSRLHGRELDGVGGESESGKSESLHCVFWVVVGVVVVILLNFIKFRLLIYHIGYGFR